MTGKLNYDRFLPLADINTYPGRDFSDRTIQLLWTENPARRVWLLTPHSSPILSIGDLTLSPQVDHIGPPRWVDYGVAKMPFMADFYDTWDGLIQVRFKGLTPAEAAESYLVVTTQFDTSLAGCTITAAQQRLWGLAQADLGITTLSPSRLEVGNPATFQVQYQAGLKGLPAGAVLRFVVPKVFSMPQIDNAAEPGYTRITRSDAAATIVTIRNMMETHEKSSIICRLEEDLPPGGQLWLEYHTARTFIYPTALHEVEMRTWYSNLPPLTASVALSAASPFVNMQPENGHTLTFLPGPATRLHLFLPGRRFASEMLHVRGIYTDRYRNVPPSGSIDTGIELYLVSDNEVHSLGTPVNHFTARHRFQVPLPLLLPGVYRIEARRTGTAELFARSNPLEIIPDGAGRRLYWGEIHCHTELGDASGEFDGVLRHAREEGCLEFATVSEHAEYISDNQWAWMQDVCNTWDAPGRFVTLVGYEIIGEQKDRIVYTSRSRLPLLRGNDASGNTLDKVWRKFHGDQSVVGGPHATLVHNTKWAYHDPTVERFIEIYSMWGSCDFRDSPLVAPWIEAGRGLTANEILLAGAKLGFTAGGDCHDGRVGFTSEDPDGQGTTPHTFSAIILFRCGMTAANMPRLDRQGLVAALRNRRTYATTGARILLDFNVDSLPMGAEGKVRSALCHGRVHAVKPLACLEIVKDGRVEWRQETAEMDPTFHWQDPLPPTREHYYYLHIIQQDGQQAWSSPVWITPMEETNDR